MHRRKQSSDLESAGDMLDDDDFHFEDEEEPLCCCEYRREDGRGEHMVMHCIGNCDSCDRAADECCTKCRCPTGDTLARLRRDVSDRCCLIPFPGGAKKVPAGAVLACVLVAAVLRGAAALGAVSCMLLLFGTVASLNVTAVVLHRRTGRARAAADGAGAAVGTGAGAAAATKSGGGSGGGGVTARTSFFVAWFLASVAWTLWVFVKRVVGPGLAGGLLLNEWFWIGGATAASTVLMLYLLHATLTMDPGRVVVRPPPPPPLAPLPQQDSAATGETGPSSPQQPQQDRSPLLYQQRASAALARAKHCRVCDRRVARFDHHCVWIDRCVGAGNHRAFVAFIALVAANNAAFVFACARAGGGWGRVADTVLESGVIDGGRAAGVMFATLFYNALVGVAMGGLAAYQLYNAACDRTTNERLNGHRPRYARYLRHLGPDRPSLSNLARFWRGELR